MNGNGPVGIVQRTISDKLWQGGQEVLAYTAIYPYFTSSEFQQVLNRLNRHYEAIAMEFARYAEQKMYPFAVETFNASIKNDVPFHPFEAVLTNTVTYNEGCVISLYFDKYEFQGGAHGMSIRNSDSWDLQGGRRLNLGDFFPCEKNYADAVLHTVREQIDLRLSADQGSYFDGYEELTARFFNKKSFYATENGIILYYQHYEIAPYSSGIPEFLIPDICEAFPFSCCKNRNFSIK